MTATQDPPPLDVGAAADERPAITGGDTTDGPPERRRRTLYFGVGDVAELGLSALGSLALTWLVFARLSPLQGGFGFAVAWYATFLLTYWLVARDRHGRLAGRDKVAAALISSLAVAALFPLVLIIGFVISEGWGALSAGFFTEDLATVGPLAPATEGGGAHAIVGTLQQVGLALAISVPIALLTAVYLNEVGGRLVRVVRFVIDAMSGVPSIVAGLFIYATFVQGFWVFEGFSGFHAALALSILMLPTVTRTAEEMLRLVPGGLREAALALGAPSWRVTLQVVLPTARAGIITAILLGTARAVGETAPVLLTAFGNKVMNWNPFSGPQDDLPLFVYSQIFSSQQAPIDRAWTGALVLMGLVLVLFVLARVVGGRNALTKR